jgi:predicted NAD-dependent protein-ADP-ribosyltransferase YbiA (DUF1768 family)
MPLPKPTPLPMDRAICSGTLVAFYYPGHNTAWDDLFQAPFLGNFWVCDPRLTLSHAVPGHDALTGHFHTSEAAFQCTKWWTPAGITAFEACRDGNDAFHTSRHMTSPRSADWGGLGRIGAMEAVLQAKFKDPALQAALLATGDAYLLEHSLHKKGSAHPHQDDFWCDNHDGSGGNHLGKCLMRRRQALGGTGDPLPGTPLGDIVRALDALLANPPG